MVFAAPDGYCDSILNQVVVAALINVKASILLSL